MLAALDAGTTQQVAQQATDVPTFVVGIITAIALPVASVFVAWLARKGEKRTSKSDHVPDIIHVLERQIDDVKTERDYWRDLAWRQVTASEEETAQAFDVDRRPPHRPN